MRHAGASGGENQPRAAIYVALLGNDPGPVYQGFKLVQNRVGGVKEARLYAQKPDPAYEKKRERFLEVLRKMGVSYTLKEIPPAPKAEALSGESFEGPPAGVTEVWVNLTGGSKAWAAILFKKWMALEAKFFVLESHRPFEPPRVVFLGPEEGLVEPLKEEEFLSLEDYRCLYLDPEGVAVEYADFSVEVNRSKDLALLKDLFQKSGDLPSHLLRLKGDNQIEEFFIVHLSRPYLYWPYLNCEKREMHRDRFLELGKRAKRLGGQLCMPLVPIHRSYLEEKHAHERPNLLRRWENFAREHGVRLLGGPIESASASEKRPGSPPEKRTEPARPKTPSFRRPSPQSTLLLANVSDQVVPLYAAYLSFAPQEVYLVSTPEKGEKLGYFRQFFQEKGIGVSEHLVSSPYALKEVEQYFSEVLGAYEGKAERVHVNLNGGTTAMALGLYRASWGRAKAHYLEGRTLYFLEGGSKEVPWEKGDPEELLFLNGYRLEKKKDWKGPPDSDLLERADEFLQKWPLRKQKTQINAELEEARRAFERRWLDLYGTPFLDEQQKELSNFAGALLEYLVFAHLYQHLGDKVRPGGHLVSSDVTKEAADLTEQFTEVDGLAYHRGTLWLVECKAVSKGKGLPKRGEMLRSVGEQIWGREVRALIVALNWKYQFSKEAPLVRGAVYMAKSMSAGAKAPGGEKVYRFPEELPQAMGL